MTNYMYIIYKHEVYVYKSIFWKFVYIISYITQICLYYIIYYTNFIIIFNTFEFFYVLLIISIKSCP